MNLEEKIIEHCAPTLAGIKTGNLFVIKFKFKQDLFKQVDNINFLLFEKRISLKVLKISEYTAHIYVFRADMLINDISDNKARSILNSYGYHKLSCFECINKLMERLSSSDDFPHEIGLFLGYPPEDVEGFICHKGLNYEACGCWKVYGDTNKALRKFEQFKKCRKMYKKLWNDGVGICRLTV